MSTCQVNPLTQFVTKGEQHHGFMHRLPQQSSDQHQLHVSAPEDVFLYGQDVTAGNQFMGGMHQGPVPMTAAVPIVPAVQQQQQRHYQQEPKGQQVLHQSSGNASWLSQFNSMKIEDPLEFSQDYKKMYSSYERSTTPMVRLPMASYRPNYSTLSKNFTKQEVSTENQDLFAAEFEALEKELEDVENKRPILDQEQKEFQKIANEIVDSCSPSPSTKLRNSKFMGLMKGVGEGSVTLNKQESQQATELHSPQTGQRVGNEYFPVKNDTLHYE
ncbi:hypothetical protein ZYGR_0AG03420 [Zygosaccharomyces rouxii]|uniref:PEX18/PEX21 C-terminal domain-containing protein n=1 Tax=Zygosaccharomyces rouxii TaxID=4956 RepID=A0A1Q3A9N6_ZYGRO|nr:hypothetical protein ZYGR_0AG03420 [Zygosaccharomyces rouxii]